ncbi:uncharacterized protein KGF55_003323 [Candida pseudojiufengensis]|uniref:uncharacterized protein n=1 Tax=Candida pseudojiufengensis TaxID=497109 RepID=UPI00222578E1|nr:uncharacterized protein KGF55_003323 [Candida pseudojiufengensis]KAI5962247.1 hypothetical protein KGF55_003323 [Candida pseudojiufengensis]
MFKIIHRKVILLLLLINLIYNISFVNGDSLFQNVTQPSLKYDLFGNRIGYFGSFSSSSFYKYIGSSDFLSINSQEEEEEDGDQNSNNKRDDNNNSNTTNDNNLFLQDKNNNFVLKFANLNGPIEQLYKISDDSIILNGNFTEFNSQSVKSPFIYNITSNSTTNIIPNNGFNGTVKTIFIDKELIYLGGDFTYNNTNGVAIYNQTSKSLNSTLFQGFGNQSIINSIIKIGGDDDTNDGSIIFGGSFNTLGLHDLLVHNITTNSTSNHNQTNSTIVNAEQVISLRHGTFTSVNAQDENENSKIICPSDNHIWDANPNSGAEWKVELADEMKGIIPTKARIYLPDSDKGIKLFRIYSYPNNGIMNLTYIDPSTNELAYCDAWCPLLSFDDLNDFVDNNKENATDLNQDDVFVDEDDGTFFKYYDPSTKTKNLGYGSNFQEFAFINQIGFDQLGLTILDWYGNQASFSGFELYQNSITTYGNNTLNEPNCDKDFNQDNNNYAEIVSGNFQSIRTINEQLSGNDYLVTRDTDAKIIFYPNITYSGNYSIIMTTPGCSIDNSCQQRAIVNVTVIDIENNQLSTKLIYQNNENMKFDYLFYGHLNSSESENNRFEVSFHDTINPDESNPIMVVDKITANIVSLDSYYDRNNTNSTTNKNSSELVHIKLNGLFEYSLANFTNFDENLVHYKEGNKTLINTNNTYIGNSSINLLSGRLSNESEIQSINLFDDTLTLLGQFESNSNNLTLTNNNLLTLNISSYNSTLNETSINLPTTLKKREDQTIHGVTFNNSISKTITFQNQLLVLGKFSVSNGSLKDLSNDNDTTSQANNFALYSKNQWFSFGNDYEDVEFDQFANPTIDDIEYFIFSSSSGSNFKTWDNTNFKWSSKSYNLTQALSLNSNQQILGGNNFNIMDFNSINQAFISNSEFNEFGFNVTEDSNSFISNSFYVNDSISIIGGKFTSGNVKNVGIINNRNPSNSIKALEDNDINWNDDSEIEAIYVDNNAEYLFMGIHGSITINNDNLTGIIIYDLFNNTFTSFQPPALSNSNGNAIHINSIVLFDEDNKLLVGGDFDTAGSLNCPSLCVYDISNTRWINPQNDAETTQSISGIITDMKFYTSNNVLITGEKLLLNNNKVNFITYNFNNGEFDTSNSLNSLNKDVKKFIINDRSSSSKLDDRMIAIGDEFIFGFDGNNWYNIDQDLNIDNTTIFNDLKLLTTEKSTSYNESLFDNNKILLVAGILNIRDYGLVNMALYNGTSWIPYVYTLEQNSTSSSSANIGDIKSILINDQNRFLSSNDLKNINKNLSKGKVVGISLACALGSTTLFGLLYIIPYFALLKNRKGYVQRIHEQDMMDVVNPEDLLHEIDLQREK